MGIPQLSVLLTHMGFLYKDPPAINQMGFLYGVPPATNIARPYGIFIWGSPSYQSDVIFVWGSPGYQYCSPTWDFYMGIPQLSKPSVGIKSVGIQPSVGIKPVGIQPSMGTKPNGHSIIGGHQIGVHSTIGGHQTWWAFSQTDHSPSPYNTYDRVWVPFSHAPAGMNQNFFVSMANFENGHLKI
jgi:hypothetical protein